MSLTPNVAWSELTPAGSDQINAGDNRVRELKTQVREVIDVDHNFPSSGSSATTGIHKKVSLTELADIGTGASGLPILGAQTIGGKPELVYTDEDDNDIQMTKAGVLKPSTSTVLADWSAIMNLVYPVGAVVTLGVSTNPATLYGVGTWTAIAGKVIVGINAGDTEFDTLDETGGAKTITLDETTIPAHTHEVGSVVDDAGNSKFSSKYGKGTQDSGDYTSFAGSGTGSRFASTTSSIGSGLAHNNLQPYIVKYVWQRTA